MSRLEATHVTVAHWEGGSDAILSRGETSTFAANVGVGVGVGRGVAVAVGAAVGVGISVAIGCGVGVAVTTGGSVGVGVDAATGLGVGVAVGTAVGVASAPQARMKRVKVTNEVKTPNFHNFESPLGSIT